jgi:hypothetical protein
MDTELSLADEQPGALLNRMLAGYRTVMESVYSLMRFLEVQSVQAGWQLVKLGGVYGVTRSGLGSGLASFSKADWVTTYVGIAFVRAGRSTTGQYGSTTTQIPENGLEVLLFQVRWLDKAPREPVVWYVKLQVERGTAQAGDAWSTRKWEDYQTDVFRKLEPDGQLDGARSGTVKPGTVSKGGTEIVFSGQYAEIPVIDILSQEDALSLIVGPALANPQ